MKQLPSVTATVLALLLVGAGVGSVTAIDTGATDALTEQRLTNTQAQVGVDHQVTHTRPFGARVASIGGTDWLDDLDGFLTVFDLPAEDHDAIVDEAAEMRADNAAAADIHHMVHYRLYQHGYDARDVHAYAVAYRLGEEFDLTDDQVTELVTGVVDELDTGADRAEVRQYIRETLESFGVEVEAMRAVRLENRLRALAERHDLTDEQTEALVDGALDLLDEDASRAALREYVRETLEAFGVELDDRPPRNAPAGDDRPRPERGDETTGSDETDQTGE